jgi:hypothetical protein
VRAEINRFRVIELSLFFPLLGAVFSNMHRIGFVKVSDCR